MQGFKILIAVIGYLAISIEPVYSNNPASKEYVDQKFAVIQQQINALSAQGLANQLQSFVDIKKGMNNE